MTASSQDSDPRLRRRLRVLLSLLVWIGLGLAVVPFLESVRSGQAPAPIAPTSVRLDSLGPGQARRLVWDGRPVWVLHRSPEQMAALRHSSVVSVSERAARYAAFYGYIDGCAVVYRHRQDPPAGLDHWPGGFWDPCSHTGYDIAGNRLPATAAGAEQLARPPYRLIGTTQLEIGAGS